MKLPSYLKKSIYSGFTFFLTVLILSIGYGALNGGLSLSDKVAVGSGLTAASWNRIVDGILDLDTRTAPISSSAGNVGINITNPQTKLDVNGDIGYSGNIYILNPIHFQVQLPLGTGIIKYTDGSLLPFGRGSDNYGGSWNISTNQFTAPIKGMYEFCISIYGWNDTGTANTVYIAPPGLLGSWIVALHIQHPGMGWEDNFKCRQTILNAGQVEGVYVVGGGLNISTSDYTYVSGRLIYAIP